MQTQQPSLPLWHPASLIATFFCVGKIPVAPGTFGSIAAFPFFWLVSFIVGREYPLTPDPATRLIGIFTVLLGILVVLFIIGTWASYVYVKRSGKEDPGEIVVDEVVGQGIVLLAAIPIVILQPEAHGLLPVTLIASLALFRYFDIKKPWPIDWCDEHIKGGFGVMFDDVVAGIMAAVTFYIGWFLIDDFIHAAAK
jgi:phosphatidylglycerophosphatase A